MILSRISLSRSVHPPVHLSFPNMNARIFTRKLATLENKSQHAKLLLATGEAYVGKSFGASKSLNGEVVFTTSVVGYPESMTDPSYHSQILVFTQPIIGNYGVPAFTKDQFGLFKHFESSKIQVAGIVVNDYCAQYSHWNAMESLGDWCIRSGVPALAGVDTRAIVTLLRENGSEKGRLSIGDDPAAGSLLEYSNNSDFWINNVSSKVQKSFNPAGKFKIALLDCGVKQNIVRKLAALDCAVTLIPYNMNISNILHKYDGVFLSNGPGDPKSAKLTSDIVKEILDTSSVMPVPVPIFGICMGHLLLGIAAGAKSFKLPFGNRGHNQPVLDLLKGGCVITSQNHGYALDDSALPAGWKTWFKNANDDSNEGIYHETLPFSSVQFHPEGIKIIYLAMGGPEDTQYLFRDWINLVSKFKEARK